MVFPRFVCGNSVVFSLLSVLDSHHRCLTVLCLACYDGGRFVVSVIATIGFVFLTIRRRFDSLQVDISRDSCQRNWSFLQSPSVSCSVSIMQGFQIANES